MGTIETIYQASDISPTYYVFDTSLFATMSFDDVEDTFNRVYNWLDNLDVGRYKVSTYTIAYTRGGITSYYPAEITFYNEDDYLAFKLTFL